jgi:hypothetical protein
VSEAPKKAELPKFSFLKGSEDIVAPKDGAAFDWERAALSVRENLGDAMNAKNMSFLLGSGCSSYLKGKIQVGIPTMKPLAEEFIGKTGKPGDKIFVTEKERTALLDQFGIDIQSAEYRQNLERLMEVLFSLQFVLKRSSNEKVKATAETLGQVIAKVTRFVLQRCTEGAFSLGDLGDNTVSAIYQAFYRKLIYRDRALPKPWVFSVNYDLFNETAMDRIGVPYSNGFSGTVERRFNPATFRYSLAEQLDITSRKWTAVDSFVYLCKLHGSINWIEEDQGLFPIREIQTASEGMGRVMIYPTPAKQNASFGSPYSDLFREFQTRIVREQSVLVVLGYSFSDEHVNNIIFQALTVPTFRMVAFVSPETSGVVAKLRELSDPRVWIVGGDGPTKDTKAHHFETFVNKFMPEPPGDKVDTAVEKVLQRLLAKKEQPDAEDSE